MNEKRERRKHERIKRQFIIVYKVHKKNGKYEVTQLKDFSEGGMLFVTSQDFLPDTILEVKLKTPISTININLLAKVIDSKQIIEGLIYNTRVSFIEIDESSKTLLKESIIMFKKIEGEGRK